MRHAHGLSILLAILAVAGSAAAAPESPAIPSTRPAVEAQLIAECDALIASAVQKPYGWAWPAAEPEPANLPRNTTLVSFDPMSTPSAALVLFYAGRELRIDRFTSAAHQAARGIMAAQQSTGRVSSLATFGTAVRGRDAVEPLPDRKATCASLSLLLTMLDGQKREDNDETIRRGAARASQWLARQQTASGAWPSLYQPADKDSRPVRLIRLDGPDYRNCTLALLLAADVLEDMSLRHPADKAVDQLLHLRLGEPRAARGLWQASYELNGSGSGSPPWLADAIDILACRYAIQTLVVAGFAPIANRPAAAALPNAMIAVSDLRYEDGQWRLLYRLTNESLQPHPKGDAAAGGPVFAQPRMPGQPDEPTTGLFGLPETLATAQRLDEMGKPKAREAMEKWGGFNRQLAWTLAGLTDQPLAIPAAEGTADEKNIVAAIRGSAEAPPGGLEARIRRISWLLLRFRMEHPEGL